MTQPHQTNVNANPARERAIGALLGLAVGDAVGTTLEFKPRASIKPISDMVGGGPFGLKPGQWTDDTSMALCLAESLIESYVEPPRSPEDCVFAQTTATISADLTTKITPCQFGGDPDCSQCGCIASAGLHAIAQHRLPIGIQVGTLFRASLKIGAARSRLRKRSAAPLIGHSQVRLEGEG